MVYIVNSKQENNMNEESKIQLMGAFNFKYSEIAKMLGVSRNAVHKWMTIEGGFPIERAKTIELYTNNKIKSEDLIK
jgi:uncharacterized protein YjcR